MRDIILKHLLDHVDKDLTEAKARMASLKESLGAESKSSAGDKHETGRAMIHLEQERVQDTVNRLEAHARHPNCNVPPKTRSSSVCHQVLWSRPQDPGCWWGFRWAKSSCQMRWCCAWVRRRRWPNNGMVPSPATKSPWALRNSRFRPFTDPARAHGTSLVRRGHLQG